MNKDNILTAALVGGILLLSLALVIFAYDQDEPQANRAKQLAYEKWSQNDLFINTLERYNEIYQKLREPDEKEALALAYMIMLTKDLFLFPSKRAEQVTLSVMLPAAQSSTKGAILAQKPYVIQQIYLGSDNGLYEALKHLIRGPKNGIYEPPFMSIKTEHLLNYIQTGSQDPLQAVKFNVTTDT